MMKELSKETLNNLSLNIGNPFFYLRRKNSKNWRVWVFAYVQVISAIPMICAFWEFGYTQIRSIFSGIQARGNQYLNYKNPRIDKLWKTANHHERNRRKIYFDFQRFLMKIPQQHSFTHPVVTPRQK